MEYSDSSLWTVANLIKTLRKLNLFVLYVEKNIILNGHEHDSEDEEKSSSPTNHTNGTTSSIATNLTRALSIHWRKARSKQLANLKWSVPTKTVYFIRWATTFLVMYCTL